MGAGPAGGKVGAPKAVNSAFGAGEERTALQKYRLKSPSRPFEGHMARTKPQGNIFSKNPTTARLTSHEGKGISKAKEARRRANTEPLSPTPFSWPSSRGRATGKQTGNLVFGCGLFPSVLPTPLTFCRPKKCAGRSFHGQILFHISRTRGDNWGLLDEWGEHVEKALYIPYNLRLITIPS